MNAIEREKLPVKRVYLGSMVRPHLKATLAWLARLEDRSISSIVEQMIREYAEIRRQQLRREGVLMPEFREREER